jgi:hypothetical protein
MSWTTSVSAQMCGSYPGDLERVTFKGAILSTRSELRKMELNDAAWVARKLAGLSIQAGILQDPLYVEKGFQAIVLGESDGKGSSNLAPAQHEVYGLDGSERTFYETFFLALVGLDQNSLEENKRKTEQGWLFSGDDRRR